MSIRAIFRFEALDSTSDLNSTSQFLFNKGVFWTKDDASVVTYDHTSGVAYVSPCRIMSYDGMVVEIDAQTQVAVETSSSSLFVVLYARYVTDAKPTLTLSVKTQSQLDAAENGDYYVKLGEIPNTSSSTVAFDNTDILSCLGYNPFKGTFDSTDDFPTAHLRDGDWAIVLQGNSSAPVMYFYNSSSASWLEYGTSSDLEDTLTAHRNNNDITLDVGYDAVKTAGDVGSLHISCNMFNGLLRKPSDGTVLAPISQDNYVLTLDDIGNMAEASGGNRSAAFIVSAYEDVDEKYKPSDSAAGESNPYIVTDTAFPVQCRTDNLDLSTSGTVSYVTLPASSYGVFIGFNISRTQDYFSVTANGDDATPVLSTSSVPVYVTGVYTNSALTAQVSPDASDATEGFWQQTGGNLYLKLSGTCTASSVSVLCWKRANLGTMSLTENSAARTCSKKALGRYNNLLFGSARSEASGTVTTITENGISCSGTDGDALNVSRAGLSASTTSVISGETAATLNVTLAGGFVYSNDSVAVTINETGMTYENTSTGTTFFSYSLGDSTVALSDGSEYSASYSNSAVSMTSSPTGSTSSTVLQAGTMAMENSSTGGHGAATYAYNKFELTSGDYVSSGSATEIALSYTPTGSTASATLTPTELTVTYGSAGGGYSSHVSAEAVTQISNGEYYARLNLGTIEAGAYADSVYSALLLYDPSTTILSMKKDADSAADITLNAATGAVTCAVLDTEGINITGTVLNSGNATTNGTTVNNGITKLKGNALQTGSLTSFSQAASASRVAIASVSVPAGSKVLFFERHHADTDKSHNLGLYTDLADGNSSVDSGAYETIGDISATFAYTNSTASAVTLYFMIGFIPTGETISYRNIHWSYLFL